MPTAIAAQPKARRIFFAPKERFVEIVAGAELSFSASIISTDFKAALTAVSFASLTGFSGADEETRFFSMEAERGFGGSGAIVGAEGGSEATTAELSETGFKVFPDFKAEMRSWFIFSARAWRRFKSSARRFATELSKSVSEAFPGFLTYFRFNVVDFWTR